MRSIMYERFHLPSRIALVCFLVLSCITACNHAATGSLPDDFLGTWCYTGSSGGMDGQGLGSKGVHRIVIRADSTIEILDTSDGLSRLVRFDADLGETIAGDRAWFLRSGKDIPEVIRLSDDRQTLTLADNQVEGFIWHFARVP
jgi:hypothetical protein